MRIHFYCIPCLCVSLLTGCLGLSSAHWEKPGASEDQYRTDLNYCKGNSYPLGGDGLVTKEMVRRMHTCMELRGWKRVDA